MARSSRNLDSPTIDPDGAFPISKSALRTIMDQLQRLDREGDNHSQLIHNLRSEIETMKPQLERLLLENSALKSEVAVLRQTVLRGVGSSHGHTSSRTLPTGSKNLEEGVSIRGDDEDMDVVLDLKEEMRNASIELIETLSDGKEKIYPGKGKRKVSPELDSTNSSIRSSKRLRRKRDSTSGERLASVLKPKLEQEVSMPPVKQELPSKDIRNSSSATQITSNTSSSSKAGPSQAPQARSGTLSRTKFPANKIQSDALTIPQDLVDQHLQGATILSIHPEPLKLKIQLPFLSTAYGAATQALLWDGTKKADPVHKFIFPKFETNPDMPAGVGEPGLLLSARTEMTDGTWSLFFKTNSTNNKVRWNYAGEYESVVVGSLSPSEFKSESRKVKETWGGKIAFHKKHLVYVDMRARMTLRKRGKKVTESSLIQERKNIKSLPKSRSALTVDDVIAAFEAGDEVIPIIRMECSSYNHEFANELFLKYKASGIDD